MEKITKYFIINKNVQTPSIGGHDYGSMENSEKARETCNISMRDSKAIAFDITHINDCYIHPENYLDRGGGKVL